MRRIRADEPRHLAALATDCTQQEIATAAKVLRALDRDVRARAAAPTTPRRDPGEAPIAADAEIYRLTTRDRLMIADVLASFDDTRWYAATLCAGWTVPHVAGHLLQPMMVGFGRFLWTPLRRGAYPVERWRRRPRRPV